MRNFQSSFNLNSFQMRRCSYPNPEWFFPDPDPTKISGFYRIRIHNPEGGGEVMYRYLWVVCSPLYRLPTKQSLFLCRSLSFPSKLNLAISAAVSTYDTLSSWRLAFYICVHFWYFRSNDDPDAWSLIGNLHLAKMEWGPAQVSTWHHRKGFDWSIDKKASDDWSIGPFFIFNIC